MPLNSRVKKYDEKRMTDSNQLVFSERVEHVSTLAASLGLAPDAWGVVMLTLLERTDTMLLIKDASTLRYVYASSAMQALIGEPAIGLIDEDWLDANACAPLRTADHSAMTQSVPQISEHRFDLNPQTTHPSGHKQEFSVTRLPLPMKDGSSSQYLCCLWGDVTPQRQLQAQHQLALEQLEALQQAGTELRLQSQEVGLRDNATGLYMWGHFEDQLRREVDLSSREHREFAIVSVALDALAPEILTLGPQAKTRVLEALGRLLRSNTRAMDASCRTEEGQFVVLLSGVGLATAHSRMEGLRRQCATQIVMLDGHDLGFTVSMGVASFPHTARSQEELLEAADAALNEALRRGGNHVALASIRFEQSY
jgi:diguanylate cyclase (GGDEF)-like protein